MVLDRDLLARGSGFSVGPSGQRLCRLHEMREHAFLHARRGFFLELLRVSLEQV